MTTDTIPSLHCPYCDEPLFPADVRGYCDDDTGEYIEHAQTCRCGRCDWAWTETGHTTCACGTVSRVDIDEGRAYASEVTP